MGNKAVEQIRSEADKKKPGGANLGKKPHYQNQTLNRTAYQPHYKKTYLSLQSWSGR